MPAIIVYALLSIPLIGAYAIFALGVSVIYRASRVLNLAHGAMAMLPAYITYSLVNAGVPMFFAAIIGIASGAALGVGVERVFVRRLRPQGPTAQTVGTVAVAGLLIAFTAKIWGSTPLIAPRVFPDGVVHIGSSGIRFGDIGLFFTGMFVSAGLFMFFKRTQIGLAMRGAAQNRRAASLMGIDPDSAAAGAWALGGALAALGGILLAAVTNLDPYNLSLQVLPAFVAALIGGLESLPGAIAGSAIAGLSFGLVPYFSGTPIIGSVLRFNGSPQLALAALTMGVMAARGRRLSTAQEAESGLSTGSRQFRPISSHRLGRVLAIAVPCLLLFPLLVPYSVLGDALLAVQLSLVALSLVVLTGWVGQISLAQASFVGISALTTGLIVRGLNIGFPANMLLAAAIAAAAASALGVVALRVRGLYLAVATLIFAWMCDSFLFRTPWMGASGGSSTIPAQRLGAKGGFPALDFTSRTTLFYVLAAVLGVVIFALANLRDTKTGRALFAVRGSEMAAASVGIDVVRTKLVAFAVAGALAGLAGNIVMIDQRAIVPSQFLFTVSLQYLSIAVVGGLGSIGGAVAAGVLFAGLNELFYRVSALSGWLDVVSAGLLAFVLLAYPGGLAALAEPFRKASRAGAKLATAARRVVQERFAARRKRTAEPEPEIVAAEARDRRVPAPVRTAAEAAKRLLDRVPVRLPQRAAVRQAGDWFAKAFPAGHVPDAPPNGNGNSRAKPATQHLDMRKLRVPEALDPDRSLRVPVLEARNVTVQFGGLTAVEDAALKVCEGEIVGLIGPNGAGKTTFFNAILGLNDPVSGDIALYGNDVTHLPPHLRARLGLARTFQVLQLFAELTVFDNLLVATHVQNGSGVLSNMAAGSGTLEAEAAARSRVREVLRLLDLEQYAHHGVRGLPFGVLRMVELGRALVTGARVVMLDEPASGLNEAETDRLAEVVTGVRALGVSVLLIEHDVRMVTGVSDYMYVLNQGKILAEGEPAEVQRHPEVIAAYLGEPVEEGVTV